MADNLKEFVQGVLRITPQYIDIFGNGVPGMAGRSAATAAAANAGSDTVQKLHRSTLEFAKAYQGAYQDKAALHAHAADIEGYLMVAVTLGVVSDKDSGHLADQLHDLLETV